MLTGNAEGACFDVETTAQAAVAVGGLVELHRFGQHFGGGAAPPLQHSITMPPAVVVVVMRVVVRHELAVAHHRRPHQIPQSAVHDPHDRVQ